MEMEEFLPIGTVVTAKEAEEKVMIVGVLQENTDDTTSAVFDYSAIGFPRGLIGPGENYLFNKNQIEHIYHLGHQNDEQTKFQTAIKAALGTIEQPAAEDTDFTGGSSGGEQAISNEADYLPRKAYLPVGTVVILKGANRKLMVVGVKMSMQNAPSDTYDYAGIAYPEGLIDSNTSYPFNHGDIEHIYHLGYQNEDWERFQKTLTFE